MKHEDDKNAKTMIFKAFKTNFNALINYKNNIGATKNL